MPKQLFVTWTGLTGAVTSCELAGVKLYLLVLVLYIVSFEYAPSDHELTNNSCGKAKVSFSFTKEQQQEQLSEQEFNEQESEQESRSVSFASPQSDS